MTLGPYDVKRSATAKATSTGSGGCHCCTLAACLVPWGLALAPPGVNCITALLHGTKQLLQPHCINPHSKCSQHPIPNNSPSTLQVLLACRASLNPPQHTEASKCNCKQPRDACTWLLRCSSRVHLNMLDGTYILSADVASHGASGTIKVIYGCCTCSLLQLYPESSSHRDTWPRALSNRHRHTYNKAQKGASQAGCCSVLC
jgi:hypothetical protein